jgi:hypothetical protein
MLGDKKLDRPSFLMCSRSTKSVATYKTRQPPIMIFVKPRSAPNPRIAREYPHKLGFLHLQLGQVWSRTEISWLQEKQAQVPLVCLLNMVIMTGLQ